MTQDKAKQVLEDLIYSEIRARYELAETIEEEDQAKEFEHLILKAWQIVIEEREV